MAELTLRLILMFAAVTCAILAAKNPQQAENNIRLPCIDVAPERIFQASNSATFSPLTMMV
jgi:hypothetical protein